MFFFFAWFKILPVSHILACVGTDVRTCPGTREPWNSPLVNHCVHSHCVLLCTCPFITAPKIQKAKAGQENIYMPTRTCAFPVFPFPERQKLPVTLSEVKQQPLPSSSSNEPICLWVRMTLRFNEERCLVEFSFILGSADLHICMARLLNLTAGLGPLSRAFTHGCRSKDAGCWSRRISSVTAASHHYLHISSYADASTQARALRSLLGVCASWEKSIPGRNQKIQ